MLITSKNKYHALNKQCFEFEPDYKKKDSILNDDNKQENTILEICIQRSFELNLFIIDLFIVF